MLLRIAMWAMGLFALDRPGQLELPQSPPVMGMAALGLQQLQTDQPPPTSYDAHTGLHLILFATGKIHMLQHSS